MTAIVAFVCLLALGGLALIARLQRTVDALAVRLGKLEELEEELPALMDIYRAHREWRAAHPGEPDPLAHKDCRLCHRAEIRRRRQAGR